MWTLMTGRKTQHFSSSLHKCSYKGALIFILSNNDIYLKFYHISSVVRSSFFVWFFFQNNPKNVDPSHKMDLYLWDCFGRVKLLL